MLTNLNTSYYYSYERPANNNISNNISDLGINFSKQFIGGTVPDKAYILETAATARKAGKDGTDCGAFGGSSPYVLSGLPSIPHIYDISAPAMGTQLGLPVKINVKTQN